MKYKIKQKVFSFGSNFSIKNEFDEDVYIIQGQVFTMGRKLRLFDIQDNELIYIEQQLLNFLPVYNIYINGEVAATIKKKFTLFRKEFIIESDEKNYTVEGDLLAHEFSIISEDKQVAQVSKEWFAFGDTYGVDIYESENHPFILALVIVLDQVCHEGN